MRFDAKIEKKKFNGKRKKEKKIYLIEAQKLHQYITLNDIYL